MNTWFRFYNEALHDPKVQKLPPKLFKHWINLLCLASQNDGKIPCCGDVAFSLRLKVDACKAVIDELCDRRLLETIETGYMPHAWEKRQFKSDGSTERVKRFRERERNVSETLHETGQTRTDTEQSRSDPPVVPRKSKGKFSYPTDFEEFWKEYPRKEGKGDALDAWKTANDRPGVDVLIAAVQLAKSSYGWTRDNGDFIPHPSTWINQRRWDDNPKQKTIAEVRGNGVVL